MRTRLLAPLAAAVLLLGACSDQTPVADDSPTRGADRGDQTPSDDDSKSPSETPTEDGQGDGATTVPAYFVGETDRAGQRLYREFQRVDGNPLEAAAELLTSGSSLDPDYRTLFPGGSFTRVGYERGTIVVNVDDDSWNTRAPGMSSAEAKLAVQQLVYTLQGVAQERAPVVVRLGGRPVPLFGIDTTDGLTAAPALDVLSHISLTSPEQGAVVDDGNLEISGVGNSFEANVGWEIRRGEEVVMDGFATMAGWMEPKLFPFETSADVRNLDPGDYTLWVTTDDPTGGTEGIGAMTDDKDFTIR